MYAQTAGDLVVFVGHPERKSWWRNLRGGAQVEVRLRGGRLCGNAIVTDADAAGSYLERFPRARVAIAAELHPTFVRISFLDPVV